VDGTAGNGHDTLFLANLVGREGCVYAFDLQKTAIDNTKRLLEKNGLEARVKLHCCDHRQISAFVPGLVQAGMFNLGYLPGGDKTLVTQAATTVAALSSCLEILAPGGIISVVTYSGHPGGREEEEAVAAWGQRLNPKDYTVSCFRLVNKANNPPRLWLIKA
jgi:tRNA G37 N-methylase Trm5